MGAEAFDVAVDLEDVHLAFAAAVEDAAWEHGHGGYTGTIAEKDSYRVFDVPPGHTVAEVQQALEDAWDGKYPDWISKEMYETYDDKGAPAVALKRPEGGWLFLGWASS